MVLGLPVNGNVHALGQSKPAEVIIALGDNRVRKEIALKTQFLFGKAIHPKSVVSVTAKIEAGIRKELLIITG
jgi:hypothetical protein